MTLFGPSRTITSRLRLVMLLVAVLSVFAFDLSHSATTLAKEIDVIGTVDCGLRSGQRCSLENTLVLLTDSVTGEATHISIDISWIKDKLPALDQDDEITLSVEILPNGKIQGLSVISARSRSGTKSQGLVNDDGKSQTGSRARKEDEDNSANNSPSSSPPGPPGILLTVYWGANPADLDSHLSGPASGGGRFHLFFLDPNPESYVSLTADAKTGFGPDQVLIRPLPGSDQYVPGDYHFWVHNFTGTPEFDASQAYVVVTKDGVQLATYAVGNAAGNPADELWYVVNVQVAANGDVTLTPVQQFTNGDGLTVLRAPYGAKPR
ncbi:MAG: hypothetical protein AB7P40_24295 [Chloroflexota bacterium]